MKIAFLALGDETYGVSRLTTSLARELNRQGHHCCVFYFVEGPLVKEALRSEIAVCSCDIPAPPEYGKQFGQAISRALALAKNLVSGTSSVAKTLDAFEPDALIVRIPNLVPIAAIAARKAKTRSFWIMPNLVSSRYPLQANKWIYELLFLKFGMQPIANSKYTASTLLGVAKRPKVLHLGIDPEEFSRERIGPIERSALGYSETDTILGIFARLVPEKGQAEMIEAIASDPAFSNVKLLVCGGPLGTPYHQQLKQLSERLNVENRVRFLGPIADTRPYYLTCDLIVNSRIDAEPFGLSIIEAMMMGRPILAHSLGGPAETIIHGQTGWLVHDPSPMAFANGLRTALTSRAQWPEIGEAAQLHARENFSIARVARDLIQLVESSRDH
ncbi:glycosyltransferase family 4 protein [Bradyrhizobium sp. UFLA05-112]